jgi:hypothetical protein
MAFDFKASMLRVVLVTLLVAPAAMAGPWLDPGDTALRHDIQLLADAGVIKAPVSTWPLSTGDIQDALTTDTQGLDAAAQAALMRLRRRLDAATVTDEVLLRAYGSAAQSPRRLRTFESGPRETGEVGLGGEWTGDRFAMRLSGQWVNDPDDDKDWRLDGSYLGMALGNWMIAASTSERYWGPGWQSSMVLSNNARPIPGFTIERNFTTPFEHRWLRWIGPWDLALLWGYLDDDRAVHSARIFAGRFNFRPLDSLEIGLAGLGLWCGSGQGCGTGDFIDLISGSGESSSFDRLASLDVRWASRLFDVPFALYTHWVGEDFGDGASRKIVPSKLFGQIGAETWGHWERFGTWRLYAEWADTECDNNVYRAVTGASGKPGCAYRNATYQSGQTYRGNSIAHSADQDSSIVTLGGMLTEPDGPSWLATLAVGTLNRRGATRNTVTPNETRFWDLEVSHSRAFWIGDVTLGLGYAYRDDRVTGADDNDIRAFFEYDIGY